jgi:hypothetical protein
LTETFETYAGVEHLPLRMYNRAVMCMNISEDFGTETLREYIANFTQEENKQIWLMMHLIKKNVKVARDYALKGLTLPDEEYDRIVENPREVMGNG